MEQQECTFQPARTQRTNHSNETVKRADLNSQRGNRRTKTQLLADLYTKGVEQFKKKRRVSPCELQAKPMEIPPDEIEQIFKRLYEQPKFAEQKKQALRMQRHLQEHYENTFSPVISERARSLKR